MVKNKALQIIEKVDKCQKIYLHEGCDKSRCSDCKLHVPGKDIHEAFKVARSSLKRDIRMGNLLNADCDKIMSREKAIDIVTRMRECSLMLTGDCSGRDCSNCEYHVRNSEFTSALNYVLAYLGRKEGKNEKI